MFIKVPRDHLPELPIISLLFIGFVFSHTGSASTQPPAPRNQTLRLRPEPLPAPYTAHYTQAEITGPYSLTKINSCKTATYTH